MSSPRSPKLFNTLNNQEVETKLEISLHHSDMPSNCTLDSSVNVEQPVVPQFMRKSSLQRYLNNNEPTKTIPLEDEVTKYTKPSLREAFLAKKQSNEASICHCRSRFLQQTSPLRNLPPESQKKTNKFLRSYSYVEENPNFLPEYMEEERKLPQVSRFTVKSIKEQVYSNRASPVKYYNLDNIESPRILTSHISRFEEIKSPYYSPRQNRSRRSTSFMSPTIASQQRNQQYMVETVKKLISPTRHGKSISPECNLTEIIDPKHIRNKKVPYIDQSKSHVEMRKPEKNSSSIKSRNHVETMEKTISAKTMFDEDLLNIDLLSLEIKTSEETLCGSIQPTSSSTSSTRDNVITATVHRIKSPEWNVALKGLAEMIELCRSMDTELLYPYMTIVNQRLLELLRSPRSHVCRTACQAAGHFFECMKDTRRPEFDDIVENLLNKTADANKFIRKDANLSLDCMVTHIPIFHGVRSLCLKGPTHKNPLVRTATIRLIVCAVVIAGPANVLSLHTHEHTRKRIIQHLPKFIVDKHLDTRKYGERLFKVLSKELLFDQVLRKHLEKEEISRIYTILKFKPTQR